MEMIGFRLFLSANLNTYSLTVNLESFGDGDLQDKFRLGARTANLEGFGTFKVCWKIKIRPNQVLLKAG